MSWTPPARGWNSLLDEFHLLEVELDRSRAAEDRDADLDLVLVEVELHAVEAGERPVERLDLVADRIVDVDLLLGRRLGLGDPADVAGFPHGTLAASGSGAPSN